MSLLDRITAEPDKLGGRPCIRGMRICVRDVLYMLADGAAMDEIPTDFPDLEMDDIRACFAYAAARVDHPVLIAAE